MARAITRHAPRGISNTANSRLRSLVAVTFDDDRGFSDRSSVLDVPVEDRRFFNPALDAAVPLSVGRRTVVVDKNVNVGRTFNKSNPFFLMRAMRSDVSAFRAPTRVAVCVRRKQRREVILALGRGGRGYRKPKYGPWSDVICR